MIIGPCITVCCRVAKAQSPQRHEQLNIELINDIPVVQVLGACLPASLMVLTEHIRHLMSLLYLRELTVHSCCSLS